MNLLDSGRYTGYAALEQSISKSFSNIQENRVFVRRAIGQTTPASGPGTNPSAIYQVDFEIRFTPKNTALPGAAANPAAVPNVAAARAGAAANTGSISGSAGAVATFVILSGPGNFQTFAQSTVNNTSYAFTNLPDGAYTVSPLRNGFSFSPPSRTVTISGSSLVTGVHFTAQPLLQVVREQASLRMENFPTGGWLITDIQGSLGSAGLVGIPGTTAPSFGNSPGLFIGVIPGGGSGFALQAAGTFSVLGGGSGGITTITITPQNGFIGPVTIKFLLPPGVTASGP